MSQKTQQSFLSRVAGKKLAGARGQDDNVSPLTRLDSQLAPSNAEELKISLTPNPDLRKGE
jgi:hypothetical protein